MNGTIIKWGDSLGIRIPGEFLTATGLEAGPPVRIFARKGRIVLEPVRFHLENLLNGITVENRHAPADTGAPVGEEIW
jgi:antitoxin MazE